MNAKETLRTGSPLNIVLWLLVSLSTFLFGLFGQTANLLLEKLSTSNIPKEVLIAGLLLSLATIPLLVVLLIVLWNDNRKLKQESIWYPMFGAVWRYRPTAKKFDPYPYCNCGERHICRVLPWRNDAKVEILACPKDTNDPIRLHFMLQDTNSNWLTIKNAIERLAHIKI